jgi:hypothetical protein
MYRRTNSPRPQDVTSTAPNKEKLGERHPRCPSPPQGSGDLPVFRCTQYLGGPIKNLLPVPR